MYFAAKWTNPRTTAKDLEKVMKERASGFAAGLTQQRQNSSQNRQSVLSDKMVFKEDNDPKHTSQSVIGYHKAQLNPNILLEKCEIL